MTIEQLPNPTGRACGSCSLCCKLVGIEALNKPPGKWCPHCKPGTGCTIYGSHPDECRDFSCLYLETAELPEIWKPTKSRIVLYLVDDGVRLVAHVDAGSPNAWREKPYYDVLKTWAKSRLDRRRQLVVRVDKRIIAILPDRDVDVGVLEAGDLVFIGRVATPTGPRYEARKMAKGAATPVA